MTCWRNATRLLTPSIRAKNTAVVALTLVAARVKSLSIETQIRTASFVLAVFRFFPDGTERARALSGTADVYLPTRMATCRSSGVTAGLKISSRQPTLPVTGEFRLVGRCSGFRPTEFAAEFHDPCLARLIRQYTHDS
jgi:hypothetical protein